MTLFAKSSFRPTLTTFTLLVGAALFVWVYPALAADLGKTPNKDKPVQTSIQSRTTDLDFNQGKAIFEGNVILMDPQMTLECDQLTAWFTSAEEKNVARELRVLEAKGNVKIIQKDADKRAESGFAKYEAETGKITLEINPKLIAQDLVVDNAKKIIYYVQDNRIKTVAPDNGKTSISSENPRRTVPFNLGTPGKSADKPEDASKKNENQTNADANDQ